MRESYVDKPLAEMLPTIHTCHIQANEVAITFMCLKRIYNLQHNWASDAPAQLITKSRNSLVLRHNVLINMKAKYQILSH